MQVIGRYELVSELGRGGAGSVWRARGPDGRDVAVKLLMAGARANEGQRRRFELEVQALLRIEHPNLVRLVDAGEHAGAPWLAMEWVEGEDLAARLRRDGPLEPRTAAELVRRIALALEHCHAQGVLHRDLKPANVLLRDKDGEPLLTDFGLTLDLAGDRSRPSVTGQLLGTPGYWAPEQARGEAREAGPATDVWGLGALLFGLLTGRPPWQGQTLPELLDEIERADPCSPALLRPGLPAMLEKVCRRCLARAPAERYGSAAGVAAALSAWLTHAQPVSATAGLRPLLISAGLCLAGAACAAWVVRSRSAALPRAASVAVPASAPAPSASAPPLDARGLAERAEARRAGGDPGGAIEDATRAIELDPRCAPAWITRARSRAERNDLDAAMEDVDRALVLAPDAPLVHTVAAHVLDRLGRVDAARFAADRAIQLDERQAVAWAVRASTALVRGEDVEAVEAATKALALDLSLVQAWSTRAQARSNLKDLDGALADADRALQLEPKRVGMWVLQAQVHHARREPDAARAAADRAIEVDPSHVGGWTIRALLRLDLGDTEGVLADATRVLELAPRSIPGLTLRAGARSARGELDGALRDLDDLIQLDSENVWSWIGRSEVHRKRGDRAAALSDAETALRLEPGNPSALAARDAARRGPEGR